VDDKPDTLAQGYRELGTNGFRAVLTDQVITADASDDPGEVRVRTWPRPFDGRAELQSRRALGVYGKEDTKQEGKQCGSLVHDEIS